MGSKMLTGSMLVIGPILAIIMLFLEPGGTTDEESFAIIAQNLQDNSLLGGITTVGWIVSILAITIGTAYLARSMQGEQKLGSDIAGLAAVLSFLAAGIVAVTGGLEMSAFDTGLAEQGADASTAIAIAEAIFRGLFMLTGAASLLLGIAIVRQKNLNLIAGGFTALFGALLLIGWILPIENEAFGLVGFIGFLGWPIMTIVLGILTIRQARSE
tara:strand:+ start:336 stop:977 length:642 start_codon:yes stop_codon:yes gene_type:complete